MKMNKEVVMVRLSDIIPNRFQPRLTFDEEALNELANSIKEHGIIQPLILRDLGSKYEIIAGERRYKAATIAGLTEVPAIIGSMDDQTSAELALIENIQRKDLSAIEEAKSYKKILDMGNFTQEQLAKRMGKGQSTIANKMRLLALTNEVQVALMNNLISERHARCLLQIKDEDLQKEVLNKIISERMNVRDTDDYIKNLLGLPKNPHNSIEQEHQEATPIVSEPESVITPSVAPSIYSDSTSNVLNTLDSPKEEEKPISSPAPVVSNEKTSDNPNVYTQVKNTDFVDISSLNQDDSPSTITPVLPENAEDENQNEGVTVMPNIENIATNKEEKDDSLTKIRLATAIRLVKDTLEDIKVAGYNATIEESDEDKEYKIVIKIEK